MNSDREKLKELGLIKFYKDMDNIESQYLNLIYDKKFDRVVEKWEYERTINLMDWKCAICGADIMLDKTKRDVENFVCEKCKEQHNNKNEIIDRRILDSRTKLYNLMESNLYEELKDVIFKGG